MIYERALVIDTFMSESGVPIARVKTQRQSTCNACELKTGCGQNLISKISNGHGIELDLENDIFARSGDVVLVELSEGGVLKASALMFLVPLLSMLVGAGIGSYFFSSQSVSLVIIALFFLLMGFGLVRFLSRRLSGDPRFSPKISDFGFDRGSSGDISLVNVSDSVNQPKANCHR